LVLDWWLTFAQTRLALVRTNKLARRTHNLPPFLT